MKASSADIEFVEFEGIRTAYRKAGDGPLLVLIHGAEADHTMFLGLMEALASSFTVVCYDQRDSGQTENGDAFYGLEVLANDAAALVRVIGQGHGVSRAHVFGTSFGGQIAQVLAARHPDAVDRLVLASTWRVGRPVSEFTADAVRELAALQANAAANAPAIAEYFFTKTYLTAHPEAIEIFRGSKRTVAQKERRARMLTDPPALDYSRVTSHTLLLSGGSDRLIPTHATLELAEHIRGTESRVLSELPHVSAVEAPERVAAAIRPFLDRRT
jgi:3-oxoadipate enol-lactonase